MLPPHRAVERWTGVAIGVAVGVTALMLQHPYPVGLFHDDGAYAILAGAVASGRGLTFLHLPGAPYDAHYPPVYPLLLSVIWRMTGGFPANVPALLTLNAVALGAVAIGVHAFLLRIAGWSNVPAAIVAIAATLCFPLLLLGGTLLSEPLFLAALMPMLILGQRIVESRTMRTAIIFGALSGLLVLIRTNGIVLPAAVALLLCARKEWRDATLVIVATAIPMLAWQIWVSAHATPIPPALEGSYGSYLGWFARGFTQPSFIARTIGINIRSVWTLIGERFNPLEITGFVHIAALLALAAMVIGARRLWSSGSVAVLSVVFYLAIVIAWPYTPWRFIYGIWPLVLILVAVGMRPAIDPDGVKPRLLTVSVLLTGWLGAGWLRQEWSAWRSDARELPIQVAAQQAIPSVKWILDHTQRNDVIVSEASELVFLYSGRRSVPLMPFDAVEYGLPRSPALDAHGLQRMLDDIDANCLVALSPAMRPAVARVTNRRLTPVDTLSGLSAYRISK